MNHKKSLNVSSFHGAITLPVHLFPRSKIEMTEDYVVWTGENFEVIGILNKETEYALHLFSYDIKFKQVYKFTYYLFVCEYTCAYIKIVDKK